MGINDHVLPGDVLIVNDAAQLYVKHPDEIATAVNLWEDDDRLVCNLKQDDLVLVLSRASAGSANGGLAFFVMTLGQVRFGWMVNHVARGFITQREPFEALRGLTVDVTSYESWSRVFGSST